MKIISKNLIIAMFAVIGIAFVSCEKNMDTTAPVSGVNELKATQDSYDVHPLSTRGTTRFWNSNYSENDVPNLICERLERDNNDMQNLESGKIYGVELRVKRSFNFRTYLTTYAPRASVFGYVSVVDKNYNEKFSKKMYFGNHTTFSVTGNKYPVKKGDRITILFKTSESGDCLIKWYP